MKVSSYILAISLALAVQAASAQADGSAAYNFLNISPSSQVYGLGGMNVSLVGGDLNTIDQNPALLGAEMHNQVELSYMRYIGDSNFAGVSFGRASGAHGAWKTSLQYFGYGSIDETLPDGSVVGSFSPKDLSLSGSYGHDLSSRFRIGATVKFLYSNYDQYTAWAVSTDLGINYYDPDRDLSVSVVGANLGGQLKRFDNTSEGLPADLRIGMTRGIGNLPLRWSVTAYNLTRWHKGNRHLFKHLVLGVDCAPTDKFYISMGYNYKVRSDMSSYKRSLLSGFSAGAGVSMSMFNVGVAVAQPHSGSTTLMLNLGLKIADIIR